MLCCTASTTNPMHQRPSPILQGKVLNIMDDSAHEPVRALKTSTPIPTALCISLPAPTLAPQAPSYLPSQRTELNE